MSKRRHNSNSKINPTSRARALRQNATESESLLWAALRGKQLCGLKFRRQHYIAPYYVDIACPEKKLIVEIDGGYHDLLGKYDLEREKYLRDLGWDVWRVSDKDVKRDLDAVLLGIARHLGIPFEFKRRSGRGSGMKNDRSG